MSLAGHDRLSCVRDARAGLTVALARGPDVVATWFLDLPDEPGMESVDRLAHWLLDAQRGGYQLRLVNPPTSLLELLELVELPGLETVAGPHISKRPPVPHEGPGE